MRLRRVPRALALVLVALAGCGSLGSGDVTERIEAPPVLTRGQVERWPEGSPARTVFEWWRALQFDNATAAARHYAASAGVTAAALDRQLQAGRDPLGLARRPRMVGTSKEGSRATVFLMLEKTTINPNGRRDRVRTPRAIDLVRERGQWKLADNAYLKRMVRLYRLYVRHAQRRDDGTP